MSSAATKRNKSHAAFPFDFLPAETRGEVRKHMDHLQRFLLSMTCHVEREIVRREPHQAFVAAYTAIEQGHVILASSFPACVLSGWSYRILLVPAFDLHFCSGNKAMIKFFCRHFAVWLEADHLYHVARGGHLNLLKRLHGVLDLSHSTFSYMLLRHLHLYRRLGAHSRADRELLKYRLFVNQIVFIALQREDCAMLQWILEVAVALAMSITQVLQPHLTSLTPRHMSMFLFFLGRRRFLKDLRHHWLSACNGIALISTDVRQWLENHLDFPDHINLMPCYHDPLGAYSHIGNAIQQWVHSSAWETGPPLVLRDAYTDYYDTAVLGRLWYNTRQKQTRQTCHIKQRTRFPVTHVSHYGRNSLAFTLGRSDKKRL